MKAERTGKGRIGWEGRLFRYISLLLIVAVLFSGVTLARYASMSGGSLTTGIARFDPSFTVDGVNSLTFGNSKYWQNYNEQWLEQGKGSARTVRIGLHNDGEVAAMPAVIHMEGPAEFWENIAFQMTEANGDGSAGNPYTTQLVFADLLKERDEGTTEGDETHNYTYNGYINWETAANKTFKTCSSDSFDQRGESEESLQMSGRIIKTTDTEGKDTFEGTVTAEGDNYTLLITASMMEVEYSVGFQRRDVAAGAALPALYLDCKKSVPYYSVDFILPEDTEKNPFVVEPSASDINTSEGLVLFFTWTNSVSGRDYEIRIERGGDDGGGTAEGHAAFTWTDLFALADGQVPAEAPTFNGATVIGYHYNHNGVPILNGAGSSTTVRINKQFVFDENGTNVTGTTVTYSHVATLKEQEGQYPHDLKLVGGYYTCTGENPVTIEKDDIDSLSTGINVGDFVYQKVNESSQDDGPHDYTLATEKGYTLSFGVTFIQAGELPAGGISTP